MGDTNGETIDRFLSYSMRKIINAHGANLSEAAKSLGISVQYLSDVMNRRRPPGKKLLDAVGYERRVLYVAKDTK